MIDIASVVEGGPMIDIASAKRQAQAAVEYLRAQHLAS
jgi:hypothetical protein